VSKFNPRKPLFLKVFQENEWPKSRYGWQARMHAYGRQRRQHLQVKNFHFRYLLSYFFDAGLFERWRYLFTLSIPLTIKTSEPTGDIFDEDIGDEDLRNWKKEWMQFLQSSRVPEKQEDSVRALLRYGLSNAKDEGPKHWFFSFCRGCWVEDRCNWHCRTCGECQDWRDWHCSTCRKCTYGVSIPCEGCDGVSETYSGVN